jgi:hypothetical protein
MGGRVLRQSGHVPEGHGRRASHLRRCGPLGLLNARTPAPRLLASTFRRGLSRVAIVTLGVSGDSSGPVQVHTFERDSSPARPAAPTTDWSLCVAHHPDSPLPPDRPRPERGEDRPSAQRSATRRDRRVDLGSEDRRPSGRRFRCGRHGHPARHGRQLPAEARGPAGRARTSTCTPTC